MKNIIHQIVFFIISIFIIFTLPFLYTKSFWVGLCNKDEIDEITSASVVIEKPEGEYVVLINDKIHVDKDNLKEWLKFFSGEEITYIFEDISCSIARGDQGAIDMSDSFKSKLPENQMNNYIENPTLLVSRIESGKFDIVIMSKEFISLNNLRLPDKQGTQIIEIEDDTKEQ